MIISSLVRIGDIRFCDYRDTIDYDGYLWRPKGMTIKSENIGTPQNTRVSVSIYDSTDNLLQTSRASGISGSLFELWRVRSESGYDQWEIDPQKQSYKLKIGYVSGKSRWIIVEASDDIGLKRNPGIPFGDRDCKLALFGPRCKYAGPETFCLRTRTYCDTVMNNLENFGGHHFAVESGVEIPLRQDRAIILPGSATWGIPQPSNLGGPDGVTDLEPAVVTVRQRQR
jgi:hypothetical protein